MDANVAPVATSASTSFSRQSQISTAKPRSSILRTRSLNGKSRNTISAHTASSNSSPRADPCSGTALINPPVRRGAPAGLHRPDGGQCGCQRLPGVLAGALRACPVADAVDEVCELAGVGIAKQVDVAADGVVDLTLLTEEGHARPAGVAGRHHSVGPEDLAAHVVAVDGLEAGLGRRHGAVVEAHEHYGGVEQAAVFPVGAHQSIGHGVNLDRPSPGV